MEISKEIILQKYLDEIRILKRILLSEYDGVSDSSFVEILKFVIVNRDVVDRDIEMFAKQISVSYELVQIIFDAFNIKAEKFNLLNFEFPRMILNKSKFGDDSITSDFVLEKIKSMKNSINIFNELNVMDLISREALEDIDNFVRGFVVNGHMKQQIEQMKEDIKTDTEYRLAEIKIKKVSAGNHILKEYFKILDKYSKCYIKIIYPFVSIYETRALKEIITMRMEYLDIKYM